MDRNEAKEYVIAQLPDFLPKAKRIGGKPSYVCPADGCGNGSGSDGSGITMIPGTSAHTM